MAEDVIIPAVDLFRPGYHVSFGRPDIKGRAELKSEADQQTLAIQFDFTNTADRRNAFVRTHLNQNIPGKLAALRLEYENPNSEPIPFAAYMVDKNKEVYLARMVLQPGKQTIEVPAPKGPAWPSGDKNNRIDYPLALDFLMLEQPATLKTGGVHIKNVEFATTVDADTALGAKTNVTEYQFGVSRVPLEINLQPYTNTIAGRYEIRIAVTDRYVGKEILTEIKPFSLPLADNAHTLKTDLALPFGSYQGTVQIVNAGSQTVVAENGFRIQMMTAGCDQYASEAEKEYEYRFGVVGGCHDSTTPPDSEKIGRRWFRFEIPNWKSTEISSGVYDFAKLKESAERWKAANIRPNTLQTLYHYPAFYDPRDLPKFAAGYGRYMQAFGRAVDSIITEHELGNEDNGATKFLYTEVGRQGSAGLRSSQPLAVIGNSGTAHIDYNWLKFQAERGLFDTVDALVVHPYTNNSTCSESASFERSGSLDHLERLYDLVYELGGMKELWNTEFGWPNGDAVAEQARTKMYLRALLIGDAVGLWYQTVYNFDRDYNTSHYAAGVPLHNFIRQRMGTRLVGFEHEKSSELYTSVYEGSGRAFAVQWTTRDGDFSPTIQGSYTDMFGNTIADARISQQPVYIRDIHPDVVKRLASVQATKIASRFQDYRKKNSLASFKPFAAIAPTDMDGLRRALIQWLDGRNDSISLDEQALFDFALRWYLEGARYFATETRDAANFDFAAVERLIREVNTNGLDVPSVRYLRRLALRVDGQARMAAQNPSYQVKCLAELALLQRAANVFSKYGQRVQYAVFTNLYMTHDNQLGEKLYFVAARPTVVRFRVSNYAPVPQKVVVRPELPKGWTGDAVNVDVPANGEVWGELTLTAPSGASDKSIAIRTQIAGKPDRVTQFNLIEYLPAVEAEVALLHARPGKLPLVLRNQESTNVKGTAILRAAGVAGAPLAIVPFEIPANGRINTDVNLSQESAAQLAQAGYSFDALFELADKRQFTVRGLDADFGVATRVPANLKIDANLDDWNSALPLKLNKDAYTFGSYGNSWSPEDLSAVTYLGWDDDHLYFAAEVRDQVVNQQLEGEAVWAQDSIQLLLTARPGETDKSKVDGIWLALTKKGPMAWGMRQNRVLTEAKVAITYGSGKFIYECAIPWSVLGSDYRDVAKRGRFGYAIAINDDDAIVPRRFLERFKGSVVHGRDLSTFAQVVLEGKSSESGAQNSSEKYLYYDNFESYEDGKIPAGYAHIHNNIPQDVSLIRAGMGEKGGHVLRMINSVGSKPHHFCMLSQEIQAEPGKQYQLQLRVKGSGLGKVSIGVCSDPYGNQDFSYIKFPDELPEWMTLTLNFKGLSTGRRRVIFRNNNAIGELLIDHVAVIEITDQK